LVRGEKKPAERTGRFFCFVVACRCLVAEFLLHQREDFFSGIKGFLDVLLRMHGGEEPVVMRMQKVAAPGHRGGEHLLAHEVVFIAETDERNRARSGSDHLVTEGLAALDQAAFELVAEFVHRLDAVDFLEVFHGRQSRGHLAGAVPV